MKVFLSWSGTLTKRVAELLRDWLPNVLQNVDPWISSEDIEKGEIWFTSIGEAISEVTTGIVCLSKDNLNAPWILFESGSLSKGITKNRVCTLLVDLEPSDLMPPLSNFNATKITKEDMFKLVKTINLGSGNKALQDQRLSASFEIWWPNFEQKFSQILKSVPATKQTTKRSLDDITAEILDTVRAIHKTRQDAHALTLEGLTGIQPLVPASFFGTGHGQISDPFTYEIVNALVKNGASLREMRREGTKSEITLLGKTTQELNRDLTSISKKYHVEIILTDDTSFQMLT
jgi:hypothetical protein